MFLSVISYISKRNEEQKNLDKREQELTTQKQKLESDKKDFEAYKKRNYEGLTTLAEKVNIHTDIEFKKQQLLEEKRKLSLEKQELYEHNKNKENELKNWKEKEIQNIQKLADEKSKGFPFLTSSFEEYFELQDKRLATTLETKSHPALKAAEEIRQMSKERREAEKSARISKHLLDYCFYLAPWLEDYIGIEIEELDALIKDIHTSWEKKEKEFEEEVKRHYGPKYEELTQTEKLQRKLDWYWKKPKKHNWQIGREYERYVGYLYEKTGCRVYYEGRKGYEDFGRDLISIKGDNIEIIQCKRWGQEKTIHEKHIFYLFGTTVEYFIRKYSEEKFPQLNLFPELINKGKIKGILFTTTNVSEKAKEVAKTLGIQIVEKFPFRDYPSIKCNISRKNGEKIYHLPFDQQYDTTLIEDEERNECYVWTIEEAESLGYRHSWRWHGQQQ